MAFPEVGNLALPLSSELRLFVLDLSVRKNRPVSEPSVIANNLPARLVQRI